MVLWAIPVAFLQTFMNIQMMYYIFGKSFVNWLQSVPLFAALLEVAVWLSL